ncbi:hypothetical protein HanRHA438_Chr13g0601901 [Helianthus annuus]|nr:hypothetical protein HanRHA438_Chr13g0601901 [Helianthus annuus]
MDIFSLLKFWRNAGVGDPITTTGDFDDENSFFDLVFTYPTETQLSHHPHRAPPPSTEHLNPPPPP